MFKKALALTLALVMLLMPMTASAVTWNTIMSKLRTDGGYDDGSTKAEQDGDTITVTGGNVQEIVIDESGKYVFRGVTIQGDNLQLGIRSGKLIDLTFDENTVFDTDKYGLDVYFGGDNSEVRVHNDTTIVGPVDSLYVAIAGEGNRLTVDGAGEIQYSYADLKYYEGEYSRVPVDIRVANENLSLDSVKDAIRIQQKIVADGDKPIIYLAIIEGSGDGMQASGEYFVDQSGALYWIDYENNKLVLIDPDFLKDEEEEEPEPDPLEELRQAEGIGGVTTSPVWNWQGYLGHSSKPMWIYVNGEKVLMRQRLFWLGDSTKNHTCRINIDEPDPASVELRIGLDMLRTAQRAEISVISILDKEENLVAQFAVSDLLGAFEQYGLVEGELLCVSADPNAEVMKVTLAGEYLPLEAE